MGNCTNPTSFIYSSHINYVSENSRQSLHFIGVQWSARMDLQWTVVFSSPITCFDCSSKFDDHPTLLYINHW